MVEKLAWAYATNANSSTTFVRHLLTAVFPVEILLVSNLQGENEAEEMHVYRSTKINWMPSTVSF